MDNFIETLKDTVTSDEAKYKVLINFISPDIFLHISGLTKYTEASWRTTENRKPHGDLARLPHGDLARLPPPPPTSRPGSVVHSAKSSKISHTATKKLAEAQITENRMGPKSVATNDEKYAVTDTFHANIISVNNLISKPIWKNISTELMEFGGVDENCGKNMETINYGY